VTLRVAAEPVRTAEARCVRFEELEDTEHAEMYPELTPQVTEVLTVYGWVHSPDASVDTP
jgi:hypothetical protein